MSTSAKSSNLVASSSTSPSVACPVWGAGDGCEAGRAAGRGTSRRWCRGVRTAYEVTAGCDGTRTGEATAGWRSPSGPLPGPEMVVSSDASSTPSPAPSRASGGESTVRRSSYTLCSGVSILWLRVAQECLRRFKLRSQPWDAVAAATVLPPHIRGMRQRQASAPPPARSVSGRRFLRLLDGICAAGCGPRGDPRHGHHRVHGLHYPQGMLQAALRVGGPARRAAWDHSALDPKLSRHGGHQAAGGMVVVPQALLERPSDRERGRTRTACTSRAMSTAGSRKSRSRVELAEPYCAERLRPREAQHFRAAGILPVSQDPLHLDGGQVSGAVRHRPRSPLRSSSSRSRGCARGQPVFMAGREFRKRKLRWCFLGGKRLRRKPEEAGASRTERNAACGNQSDAQGAAVDTAWREFDEESAQLSGGGVRRAFADDVVSYPPHPQRRRVRRERGGAGVAAARRP